MKVFCRYLSYLLIILFVALQPSICDAVVNVKGYYKSNGTYVPPHVRSDPNGLKYDNYSYKPSQGLYNKTYGTRGVEWDTPTYISDPNYYTGKSQYESKSSGYVPTYTSSYTNNSLTNYNYSSVYGGYKIGTTLFCDYGYYKKDNLCIKAPENSTAYGSDNFYCDTGYKQYKETCVKEKNKTYVNNVLSCESDLVLYLDRCVTQDTFCRSKYGEGYFYYKPDSSCASCPDGSIYNSNILKCQTKEQIEIERQAIIQEQLNARIKKRTQNLAVPITK